MSVLTVTVEVTATGMVQASRGDNRLESPASMTAVKGLDAELIEHFRRWLVDPERPWLDSEIRSFGALLHRCLFTGGVWPWVQQQIDDSGETVRLQLVFPQHGEFADLATIPWEYLCRPEKIGRTASFLAADNRIVLSRHIYPQGQERPFDEGARLRALVVSSKPASEAAVSDEVIETVERTAAALEMDLEVLRNITAVELAEVFADATRRPHLLHFIGHGVFDPEQGQGSIALVQPDRRNADWLDDRRLADILCQGHNAPRAVLLHSCEGARTDLAHSFAGLSAQLLQHGVRCVIGMQYPVLDTSATEFSTALYTNLARGMELDVAVQRARWTIRTTGRGRTDPRLFGNPVIYQRHVAGLFARAGSAVAGVE